MPQRQLSRFDRSADRLLAALRRARGLSGWQRYGISTIAVLAAAGARQGLEPLLHDADFTLFFPAVMLCALLFDSGTGIFATLLSTVLVVWLFAPVGADPAFLAHAAVFLIVGLFTSVTLEALHRSTARLADALTAARRLESYNRTLLDELNHRVKNSMQVLSSLITLRAQGVRDAETATDFRTLASQVHVLGRVYSRLRFAESHVEVDAGAFMDDLLDDLKATLIGERPIILTRQIDTIHVSARRMVSLGLVTNELVTNAVQHAFPAGRGGSIEVRLTRAADALVLEVADDGVGAPGDARVGLGRRLLEVLARQLRGHLEQPATARGTLVRLTLPAQDDGEL
jgi:two-component sensor histidine kinase